MRFYDWRDRASGALKGAVPGALFGGPAGAAIGAGAGAMNPHADRQLQAVARRAAGGVAGAARGVAGAAHSVQEFQQDVARRAARGVAGAARGVVSNPRERVSGALAGGLSGLLVGGPFGAAVGSTAGFMGPDVTKRVVGAVANPVTRAGAAVLRRAPAYGRLFGAGIGGFAGAAAGAPTVFGTLAGGIGGGVLGAGAGDIIGQIARSTGMSEIVVARKLLGLPDLPAKKTAAFSDGASAVARMKVKLSLAEKLSKVDLGEKVELTDEEKEGIVGRIVDAPGWAVQKLLKGIGGVTGTLSGGGVGAGAGGILGGVGGGLGGAYLGHMVGGVPGALIGGGLGALAGGTGGMVGGGLGGGWLGKHIGAGAGEAGGLVARAPGWTSKKILQQVGLSDEEIGITLAETDPAAALMGIFQDNPQGLAVEELAQVLGCNPEEVDAVMTQLAQAGMPIAKTEDGKWALAEGTDADASTDAAETVGAEA